MKKDHSLDELEHDQNEGNAFSAARSKAIKDGKEDFTVDGKTYPVKDADADEAMDEGGIEDINETTCEKCGKQLCECGDMYEEESINETVKSKKIFRLTESQLIDMISKMVNESIPGLSAVENAHKIGDKETKEHMANVDKKIKDSLSIDGNDNPEFPKPIGKGEKMAVNNTEDMDEEMSMDRGENPLDLDYDHEPSDSFKERVKKALEGHSSMGNADGGNTIPSNTGKNIAATAEKRKKHKEEAPMYVKDVQPVNEGEETKDSSKSVLQEEISKMKKLSSYNEKTQ